MNEQSHILHDRDIREPLFDWLEETYGQIRILEEKTMGRSRADIVMVCPEGIWGIEIKSDADTYARLATQVKDYDQYFDHNIAVVGSRHALHIEEHLPDHWGIVTVDDIAGQPDFYLLRCPKPNPLVTWNKKLRILWRPELAQLQEAFAMPKYKEKSRDFVIGKITEKIPAKIPEEALNSQMIHLLMERDYTRIDDTLREYRRSETSKKLDATTESSERLQILIDAAGKTPPVRRRRRRRPLSQGD